jgi:thiol-disulfide isomerase/thioredoxin
MQTPDESAPQNLLVACLCAQWCGTCRDYQPLFDMLQQEFPLIRFLWIDIEDESDLVDPVEVENFPTLLIADPKQVRFFGTLTPHIETLRRLIQTHLIHDSGQTSVDTGASQLAQRLRQLTV